VREPITWQERTWPTREKDIRASIRDAHEIARRRRQRKRQERLHPVLWGIGIFAWIYLCLQISFG
jgi:cell division protein FtsX